MNEKILEKIKKCLRLAKSSNENEAAAAMRQAQKLMRLHGIEHGYVVAAEGVESQNVSVGSNKKPSAHVGMLAHMVCRAFGVDVIWSVTQLFGQRESRLEFYGMDSAPEVAGYAFEVLFRQLKRDRTRYMATLNKRLKRTTKTRRGDLYAQAWVQAVEKQITAYERSEEEKAAVQTYREQRWPEVGETACRDNTAGTRRHDYDAARQGYRDGEKVDFHRGVNGPRQAALGHGGQA
ncbi:DUF2786 domain-containing protein [Marinobacter sp. MCTG268]|uniref:DUF2786 domain-containing protein n=1 Tax=Marinobacter adhaerens TaxID=1033846 RepID=UPI00068E063A